MYVFFQTFKWEELYNKHQPDVFIIAIPWSFQEELWWNQNIITELFLWIIILLLFQKTYKLKTGRYIYLRSSSTCHHVFFIVLFAWSLAIWILKFCCIWSTDMTDSTAARRRRCLPSPVCYLWLANVQVNKVVIPREFSDDCESFSARHRGGQAAVSTFSSLQGMSTHTVSRSSPAGITRLQ